MAKIFELIVGYPPFDNLMPSKDDLIREWISMFGKLPEEWPKDLPSTGTIGTWLPLRFLQSFGTLWQ